MSLSLKEVSNLIAEYENTKAERLKLDQSSAKLKVKEDRILDQLTASNVESGVFGPFYAEVKSKAVPRCTDWPTFHQYLIQTGNLDMLHKRLTETAVMARVEDGEYVPAIVVDEKKIYKFSIA